MSVTWQGSRFDERTRDMLVEAERLWGLPLVPSQGSYNSSVGASAGTHAGCGAVDVIVKSNTPAERDRLIEAMRRVGFAAWLRTPSQSDWPWHVHGIAVQPGGRADPGCLHPSAHAQVMDYYAGRNGLASRGADDGPRDWVGTTWEKYRQGNDQDDQEVPDMRIIEAPKRGAALYSGGYFKVLTPEQRDVLLGLGIPIGRTNERGFDVVRAAVSQGSVTDRVEDAIS